MDILDDVDLTKSMRKDLNTEDFMAQFEVDDQVLVRAFVRPRKLQSKFEPGWTMTALYNACAEVSNGRKENKGSYFLWRVIVQKLEENGLTG